MPVLLEAVVSRGPNKGTMLSPHLQNDTYIVSVTRYEKDYIRVRSVDEIIPYLQKGFSLRMSAPKLAPSLINPKSINGWR